MIPDIIGKPHTWCYKVLGWRLKLTKSAFRRISQLKLVPAPGHWSGRRCLGSGRLRVSELAAGSLAAAYLGLETPQTGCMQCCSYLSGLQRFTDHTQHTSCLCKTSHPLRGFTGAHCCRGGYQGIRGDIVHCGRVLAAGWWPGTACCSVSGPRRVAATTTVAPVARLLAGTGGCCSVWPGRLQCLCSLQHRHALHYTVATSRVHRTAH